MRSLRDEIKQEFSYYLTNVARSARRTSDGFNLGKTAVGSFLSFIEVDKLFDYAPEKWSHIQSIYDITDPIEVKQIADLLLNDRAFLQHDSENNQGWRSGALSHYACFINARSYFFRLQEDSNSQEERISTNRSLQQIFYGAPGTGKSKTIKNTTEEAEKDGRVFRTTFHPDSDYSTFVGCYKPTKVKSFKQPRMDMSLDDLAKALGSYYKNEELGKIGGLQQFCIEYYPYIDGEYMSVNVTKLIELAGVPKDYNVEVNKYIKFIHLLPHHDPDKITYEFIPQAFTNAYVKAWNTEEGVYLIIEEINRGNCAQIFGDLFQLLDRKNGVSEYPIDADADLANYLSKKLAGSTHKDITDEIREGKKLKLPSNLYIWATMNTSDQSLFPIDSAFKRRWDWKYIPIKEHTDKNYKIEIGEKIYDWWGFLERINKVIGDTTSSEDKKLGYFFVKTETSIVSDEQFVGKVLFYIWNDVFKNYGFDHTIFSKGEKDKFVFSDFFNADGTPNKDNVQLFLKRLEDTIKIERPLEITTKEESTTASEDATVPESEA